MPGQRPTKPEIAKMRVLSELGETPKSIGRKLGRSNHTVAKYLATTAYTDPDIAQMVETIKERELDDLFVLNARGRAHLHALLDAGTMKPIETIALVDRSFQQRQLLTGRPTTHLLHTSLVVQVHEQRKTLSPPLTDE